MGQPQTHSLLRASLCGVLVLGGCDARYADAPQTQEVDGQAAGLSDTMCGYTCPSHFQAIGSSCRPECGPFCPEPYNVNATTCTPICDSREGTHGELEADFRYHDAYAYDENWCTTLPTDVCIDGSYYYSHLLSNFFCHTVGSNGSCGDPDAIWEVNCRSRIDCVYNCEGECVKTDC
ncbi:hypothetical protein [Myxococcus xanthus]|uniref:hypothetical protein n=1 Tax=Myxococcus xanthus TaxID=34 RepID=UPI001129A03E|nr:hypothetical protein [Myxococcus xanthus]